MSRSLGDAFVNIAATGKTFGAEVARIVKAGTSGIKADIPVTVNDLAAKLSFAELKKARDDLAAKVAKIGVDVNDKAAQASLLRLKARIDELAAKKISPEIELKDAARVSAQILSIDAALDRLGRKDVTAHVKVDVDKSALDKLDLGGGLAGGALLPSVAAVSLPAAIALGGVGLGAAAGLGGAAVAGAGALAAFGAVAKPVLSDTLKAEQAVNAAQNAYNATISAGVPKAQAQATLQAANARAVLTYNAAIAGGANPAKALAAEHLALAKNQAAYNAATSTGTFNAKAYAAEQLAINKAYANLSPQQITLSQQLGKMASAWDNLKASYTPLISSALQPWLAGITTALGQLGNVLKPMAPVVHDLGVQFSILTSSSVFKDFVSWIGKIGAVVNKAVGNAFLDFLTAVAFLLPQFTPLIKDAAGGLTKWADAFVKWSASQKASDDIKNFIKFVHDNGPTVRDLLANLGGAIKALAPGFVAGGQLELKVISDFLGLVAKLPKGLAAPLAEVAGAAVILSKLPGGTKVINFLVSGALGGIFAGKGGAASIEGSTGLWAKLLPGVRLLGAVLGATVILEIIGKSDLQNKGQKDQGLLGDFAHGVAVVFDKIRHETSVVWDLTWKETVTRLRHGVDDAFKELDTMRHNFAGSFDQIRHDLSHSWDLTWNNTLGRLERGRHDLAAGFDGIRHDTSDRFDSIRHDVSSIWDVTWNNTLGRLERGRHDVAVGFDSMRHDVATKVDSARHDLASLWDRIWADTIGKIQTGIVNAVNWFRGMPGRIIGALGNLLSLLETGGRNILTGLLNGVKSAWNDVLSWFKGFPSKILQALGIKSPPQWAIDAGKHIMGGLLKGIAHNASDVKGFFTGLASDVTGPLKSVWSVIGSAGGALGSFLSKLVGGGGSGVARWRSTVLEALQMEGLSPSLVDNVLYQMQTESGGNPNAINLTDINAQHGDPSRGLMQTIGSTFSAFHWPGTSTNIYDPLANIAAAINYARHTYGPNLANSFGGIGSGHGYALGTNSAVPGWAVVGENGPEIVHFRGGERVTPATALNGSSGSGNDAPMNSRQANAMIERLDKLIAVTVAAPHGFARSLNNAASQSANVAFYSGM